MLAAPLRVAAARSGELFSSCSGRGRPRDFWLRVNWVVVTSRSTLEPLELPRCVEPPHFDTRHRRPGRRARRIQRWSFPRPAPARHRVSPLSAGRDAHRGVSDGQLLEVRVGYLHTTIRRTIRGNGAMRICRAGGRVHEGARSSRRQLPERSVLHLRGHRQRRIGFSRFSDRRNGALGRIRRGVGTDGVDLRLSRAVAHSAVTCDADSPMRARRGAADRPGRRNGFPAPVRGRRSSTFRRAWGPRVGGSPRLSRRRPQSPLAPTASSISGPTSPRPTASGSADLGALSPEPLVGRRRHSLEQDRQRGRSDIAYAAARPFDTPFRSPRKNGALVPRSDRG